MADRKYTPRIVGRRDPRVDSEASDFLHIRRRHLHGIVHQANTCATIDGSFEKLHQVRGRDAVDVNIHLRAVTGLRKRALDQLIAAIRGDSRFHLDRAREIAEFQYGFGIDVRFKGFGRNLVHHHGSGRRGSNAERRASTSGRGGRRIRDLQPRSGISQDNVVASIVAGDPAVRHDGSRNRVRHHLAVLHQRQKAGGENAPPLIEDIESISNSAPLQQPHKRIAERLHHRLAGVGLEGISPGAIDMTDDRLRSLQQQLLRQTRYQGFFRDLYGLIARPVRVRILLRTSGAVTGKEEMQKAVQSGVGGNFSRGKVGGRTNLASGAGPILREQSALLYALLRIGHGERHTVRAGKKDRGRSTFGLPSQNLEQLRFGSHVRKPCR